MLVNASVVGLEHECILSIVFGSLSKHNQSSGNVFSSASSCPPPLPMFTNAVIIEASHGVVTCYWVQAREQRLYALDLTAHACCGPDRIPG